MRISFFGKKFFGGDKFATKTLVLVKLEQPSDKKYFKLFRVCKDTKEITQRYLRIVKYSVSGLK